MTLPHARHEQLLVRTIAHEIVVYDLARAKVHALNRTAAIVWRCCDGRTTVAEAAAVVAAELDQPPSEEIVCLALEQLSGRHLLQAPFPAAAGEPRARRREVLAKLAVALVALPAILSMASPASGQAKSKPKP